VNRVHQDPDQYGECRDADCEIELNVIHRRLYCTSRDRIFS
jgi:hypothetical protein